MGVPDEGAFGRPPSFDVGDAAPPGARVNEEEKLPTKPYPATFKGEAARPGSVYVAETWAGGVPSTRRFVRGNNTAPFSIGRAGEWIVEGHRTLDIHAFAHFDGDTLLVCSTNPAEPALLNGVPLPTRWTPVFAPAVIEVGGAEIRYFADATASEPLPEFDDDVKTTVAADPLVQSLRAGAALDGPDPLLHGDVTRIGEPYRPFEDEPTRVYEPESASPDTVIPSTTPGTPAFPGERPRFPPPAPPPRTHALPPEATDDATVAEMGPPVTMPAPQGLAFSDQATRLEIPMRPVTAPSPGVMPGAMHGGAPGAHGGAQGGAAAPPDLFSDAATRLEIPLRPIPPAGAPNVDAFAPTLSSTGPATPKPTFLALLTKRNATVIGSAIVGALFIVLAVGMLLRARRGADPVVLGGETAVTAPGGDPPASETGGPAGQVGSPGTQGAPAAPDSPGPSKPRVDVPSVTPMPTGAIEPPTLAQAIDAGLIPASEVPRTPVSGKGSKGEPEVAKTRAREAVDAVHQGDFAKAAAIYEELAAKDPDNAAYGEAARILKQQAGNR
jgi:hypothetical protein